MGGWEVVGGECWRCVCGRVPWARGMVEGWMGWRVGGEWVEGECMWWGWQVVVGWCQGMSPVMCRDARLLVNLTVCANAWVASEDTLAGVLPSGHGL